MHKITFSWFMCTFHRLKFKLVVFLEHVFLENLKRHWERLDWAESHVCVLPCVFSSFFFFFFFWFQLHYLTKSTVNSAQMHCSWVSQIPLFNHFFIKNESYDTIHTFKNYSATMFSVSTKISSIQTDPLCSEIFF